MASKLENKIAELRNQIRAKQDELHKKAKEARALDNTTDMQAVVDACKSIQADIEKLQEDLKTAEEAMGLDTGADNKEQNDDTVDDTIDDPNLDDETDSKRSLENVTMNAKKGEIRKINPKGEIRKLEEKNSKIKNEEVRSAFNKYLHTKGEVRDGLKSADASSVILPNQLLSLQIQPTNIVNLGSLVNRQAVSSPSGSLPIWGKDRASFVTKEELAQNPQVANPVFSQANYNLKTWSAFLTLAQEAIDDTAIDLTNTVTKFVTDGKNQLEERLIGNVLNTFDAAPVANLDELKDVNNVQIPIGYNKQVILSQSAYGELDKLKDSNGRYLLQDSITAASGKQLFGLNVVVVNDEVLQTKDETGKPTGSKLNLFIGDPKAAVLEAYKTDIALKFIDSYVYGVQIGAYFRVDVVKADGEAGKFITLNFDGTPDQTTSTTTVHA